MSASKVLLACAIGCVPLGLYLALQRQRRPPNAGRLVPINSEGESALRTRLRDKGNQALQAFGVEDQQLGRALRAGNLYDASWALNRIAVLYGEVNGIAQALADAQLQATARQLWATLSERTTAVGRMR